MYNMKNLIPILLFVIIFTACSSEQSTDGNERENLLAKISETEDRIYSGDLVSITADEANLAILQYSRFANEFPQDSLSPNFLFKAAEMFRAVNNGSKAILYYKRIVNDYPESRHSPISLFLQGFVYENVLLDFEKAKQFYSEYLEKYPEGEFANDTKILIQNLGISPEDLIKSFENNLKNTEE